MNEATARMRSATEAIWTTAPDGLEALATMHRPPSSDLVKRLYANFDAYWLAGMLYQLRELAGDERLDSQTLSKVAGCIAKLAARRLRIWGLEGAATAIETAAGELSEATDPSQLRSVLAELIVFIDRIHVWIDSTIPWAGMDALTPLPAPRPGS